MVSGRSFDWNGMDSLPLVENELQGEFAFSLSSFVSTLSSRKVTISAGSIKRPWPTSPQASSPAGDSSTTVSSNSRKTAKLRLTAGLLYIATFIAGAITREQVQLIKQRLTGSSAMPQANFPITFAVAGTTR